MQQRRGALLVLCVLVAAGLPSLLLLLGPAESTVGSQHRRDLLSLEDHQPTWSRSSSGGGNLQLYSIPTLGHIVAASAKRLLQQLTKVAQPINQQSSAEASTEDTVWVKSLLDQLPGWIHAAADTPADDSNCPGCASGSCLSTDGGFKCTTCQGSLFVSRADGSCGCPSGRYQPADQPMTCKDCEKGQFCLGGKYMGPGVPAKTACTVFSEGLTTLGLRSSGKKMCVNLPGYLYSLDANGDPKAAPCPEDSYGPGLRKQRACVACPSGFTTYNKTKQTAISSCSIPAGYYQISPGRASPCPRGTYKTAETPAANCTACVGLGVTTPGEASVSEKNCSEVTPGNYATSVVDGVVKQTAKCPPKYYCPGGTAKQSVDLNNIPASDPTIVRCPQGTWTQSMGSSQVSLCVTPPGHYTTATGTQPCPNGEYRTGWAPPDQAASCIKCSPDGSVQSMETEILTVLKLDGTEASMYVKSAVRSCYIVGGQGLVFDAVANTYKAVNCDKNQWGVPDNTFGLNALTVCGSCAANMITSKDAVKYPISAGYYKADNSTPPRGGFTNKLACVTQAGWGVVQGVATPCPVGQWSAGDGYSGCTQCPFGTTTNGTQEKESDCMIASGFGWLRNSIAPCPVGTFNDQVRANGKTPCMPCPGGSTNTVEGAASKASCNLCKPGFGGAACDVCGGPNPTYGPGTRPIGTECIKCPTIAGGGTAGFDFVDPKGANQFYMPRIIAAIAATQATECISEFTQVGDNAWSLDVQSEGIWGSGPITQETFSDCANLCTFDEACQFMQFDYQSTENNCRLKVQPSATGTTTDEMLCFKAIPSSSLGASSVAGRRRLSSSRSSSRRQTSSSTSTSSRRHLHEAMQELFGNSTVTAKTVVSSGKYTIWRDPTASRVGQQKDPPQGIPLSYDSCFKSCDEDGECSGVYLKLTAINAQPQACKLIFGDSSPGVFKRSMTRMVARAENMDMWTIMGFS